MHSIQAVAFSLFVLAGVFLSPGLPEAGQRNGEKATACAPAGRWLAPGDGSVIDPRRLIDDMAKRPVVMLGETHTSAEHHRWQLQTMAALYGRNPNMVLGFESFPRSVQPVLDRWTRGELGESEFLELTRWNDVWGYDPDIYMPLFHFARMNRIPMRALNVERELIGRIRKDGWASIPAGQRRGIGDPLAPSKAYRESLEKVFELHRDDGEDDEKRLASFIEIQTFWDRAMAEEIARVRKAGGEPLVVVIVGRGHVEYGFGISHQLSDLGVDDAAVLLSWDKDLPCRQLKSENGLAVADAVYGVDAPPEAAQKPYPMLGVQIENADGGRGAAIVRVVKGSVAVAAGLKKGDIVVRAASLKVTTSAELVATIRATNPGTWLPLTVERDGRRLSVTAKFPILQDTPERP